jgi:hypothetical protein
MLGHASGLSEGVGRGCASTPLACLSDGALHLCCLRRLAAPWPQRELRWVAASLGLAIPPQMIDHNLGVCAHTAERCRSDRALPRQANIAERWHARAQAPSLEHIPGFIQRTERGEVAQVWPVPRRKHDAINGFLATIAPDHAIVGKALKQWSSL